MTLKVALLCGGPSLERGISLNSARSVLDHLDGEGVEIVPYYFDHKRRPFAISRAQLYSNTPSDFDFKLQTLARPLSLNSFARELRKSDIVFPVLHGAFGEDGELQALLEKWKIPFVGSSSAACKRAFDKHKANEFIREHGFYAPSSIALKIYEKDHKKLLSRFFTEHKIKRAVVKPASGGSSIGVFSVGNVAEALEAAHTIFSKRMDTRVVVEPFAQGREFTVIILQNAFGLPVAVLPTEIEVDYAKNQIFDFRKKYLPSRQVTYHCPPRFADKTIEQIQIQAEQIFALLGMRDFARFDGWVLDNGEIWFSDFNPLSGMEQNSFLFQQSTRIGLSHRDVLRFALKRALQREKISVKDLQRGAVTQGKKKPVQVIFGGNTSERQVSLMSGSNVWLKLLRSKEYLPKPHLLDLHGDVWEVPYTLLLNHTVEEVLENCEKAAADAERVQKLIERVVLRLGAPKEDFSVEFFLPKKMSLTQFVKSSQFVFIALHGGIGENGELQKQLERAGVLYNGSNATTSALCMDKYETNRKVAQAAIQGVSVPRGKVLSLTSLERAGSEKVKEMWRSLTKELGSSSLIIKPRGDGCSSGVVRASSADDLLLYLELARIRAPHIPPGSFPGQSGIVEMPIEKLDEILVEQCIETDVVRVKGNALKYIKRSGLIEITCGVLGEAGHVQSLNPSITVAEGAVLSLEEKFQGGTGVNITPPPETLVPHDALIRAKRALAKIAETLGVTGYARIDAFLELRTGAVTLIEVNNLPGLTPSTVLYHQALAEKKPMYPVQFLERLVKNKGY